MEWNKIYSKLFTEFMTPISLFAFLFYFEHLGPCPDSKSPHPLLYLFDFMITNHLCSTDSMSRKQTPSDFLKQIIGRPVVVKLNSGVDYRGTV